MKPVALMQAVESLYNSFNPKMQTLDSYIEDTLGDCDGPDADPDKVFMKQVLYSCLRFRPGLQVRAGEGRRSEATTAYFEPYFGLASLLQSRSSYN